jgi:hypothetical protein
MLVVIDKTTKKVLNNMGTNSAYPDGNLSYEAKENEQLVKIHDDSDLSKTIQTAYDYDLVLDSEGNCTDVIIHKTLAQKRNEIANHPDTIKSRRKAEIQIELDALDKLLDRGDEDMIDFMISKNMFAENELPGYIKSRKKQKKDLRQELQNLG